MGTLLDSISGPNDLKQLPAEQVPQLAEEIREYIREFTRTTGGHIGSGLGVVELTIALHTVFDFSAGDRLIWDVGHQCYPHKILTGRRDRMLSIRQYGGLSGFPDPKESPYDTVKTGHGGTSLTTALGLAAGLRLSGNPERRRIVAVIGDGALEEGVALEALNHGGTFDELPLLIVLNDNKMGISPAVGALSRFFSKVRAGRIYRTARENVNRVVANMERETPSVGRAVREFLDHMRAGVHGMMPNIHPGVVFEALGFFYYGPIDGHDAAALKEALSDCREITKPMILHCVTTKGKGYAEKEDLLCYHAGSPAKHITTHLPKEFAAQGGKTYTDVFVEEVTELAREDERVVALTAAMLEGTGLVKFKQEFPDRCFDVGMAEQHAVGMAQGLALSGKRPICAVYSTFLQRAIDQLFQEISLANVPVVFCLDRAGLVGPDGATHNGVFDIAYCRMLPNMTVMAPRDATELRAMLRLAIAHNGPCAIRFPRTTTPIDTQEIPAREFGVGEAELLMDGRDGCLLAYGAMVYHALEVAHAVEKACGKRLAVVNARFAKPLDGKTIEREFSRQPFICSLEDHVQAGGFGSAVAEYALAQRLDARKFEILAIPDRYIDHGQRVEVLAEAGLDVASLKARMLAKLAAVSAQDTTAAQVRRVTM